MTTTIRSIPGVPEGLYLTADIAPLGGHYRARPEDFLVEEIPLYEPCGEGEHVYVFVEKKNMTTQDAVRIVAKHFGVRDRDVGYAGLKDKVAITRQVLSVHTPGKTPEDFPMFRHENLAVLWTDLHTNKLRLGHLRGNRFSIRIRDVSISRILDVRRILHVLKETGAPNFFGPQRFGVGMRNHEFGRLLLEGDAVGVLDLLFTEDVDEPVREAFAAGDFAAASGRLPRWRRPEAKMLGALHAAGALDAKSAKRALRVAPRKTMDLWNSALQSAAFNMVLSRRLAEGRFDGLSPGDIACKHDNGALFTVTESDAAGDELRRRLSEREISPTGPLWGPKMLRGLGDCDAWERDALKSFGLSPDDLPVERADGRPSLPGDRRPLRVVVGDPEMEAGADEHGQYIRCAFDLPAGAYATTVLREIMKSDLGSDAG